MKRLTPEAIEHLKSKGYKHSTSLEEFINETLKTYSLFDALIILKELDNQATTSLFYGRDNPTFDIVYKGNFVCLHEQINSLFEDYWKDMIWTDI